MNTNNDEKSTKNVACGGTTMFELADSLKSLKDAKKELEQEVKNLTAQIEEVDYALSEIMAQTETQSFSRAGTMFFLTNTVRASAVAERKEELFKALKAHDSGELVCETVNANSLSSFVKEQTAENDDLLPDWLEGLVSVYEKTTVGVRKATK